MDNCKEIEEGKMQLVEMSLKLLKDGLLVGTWGNLSTRIIKDNKEYIIITPSGMDYESTKTGDLLVIDIEGNILQGNRKPTTEIKMHTEIYKNRKDINAVFHFHSIFATACAVSDVNIPMIVEDCVQHVGGDIKVAKYALPGTYELAMFVVEALKDRKSVLLKNHGAIGIGSTMIDAYKSCVLTEKTAKIFILSKLLGNVTEVSEEDAKFMIEYYNTKYGQK